MKTPVYARKEGQNPKGGDPNEWSARKAQMVAKEYQAKGGGYK